MKPEERVGEVELRLLHAADGTGPVTCGLPWPRGALREPIRLGLCDGQGQPLPLQARVLDRWSDGSVRWVLLDWQAYPAAGPYRLSVSAGTPLLPANAVTIVSREGALTVATGAAQFECGTGNAFPFRAVRVGAGEILDMARSRFAVEDENGQLFVPRITTVQVEEAGPVRATVHLQGDLASAAGASLADLNVRLHFFAGSAAVRFELTIRNPRNADHPGGLWDLGNGGSIYLRDAALTIALPPGTGTATLRCSPECGAAFENMEAPLELYQDSSGGENWRGSNHLNRKHIVPTTFRGYRLKAGGSERSGLRATPAVALTAGSQTLAVTVPCFWQNFPMAVEAAADALVLRLFPHQYADVHEIQAGEQKTYSFTMLFGAAADAVEPALRWFREPPLVAAAPDWYCASGALPYLTPKSTDPNTGYLQLVDAAIEGADTFDHKREVIDEYGWRHFGDIYGDHEAVFHKGPTPLVSHYNNQYDPIAGFAYQFVRSGDGRWFRHMDELAAHVRDIDIYHTSRDKAAYNNGLFWHTFHYVDADTGTHRSYPKAARVCGGGPANEQNYATGLMLHYFLTGNAASRSAALGLAQWVIDMDDGRKTVFRWLAGGNTGLASSSRTAAYHGPGRGGANSIAALVDGHRLSNEAQYLAKAEQLLRRCIHPADNVPARNLLDAENRWFYTMFLQSVGRYLDYKTERGEVDRMYAYAQASLLHYVRWMAENEYPYLEKPEILEYPTETWVAQDMRKSEIFKYAAKHSSGEERTRFLERSEFFFRYAVEKLSTMPTRTLARPVVLLLSYGYMHAYFQKNPDESAPRPAPPVADFGAPEQFVPQKVRALKRFKLLAAAGACVGLLAVVVLLILLFR